MEKNYLQTQCIREWKRHIVRSTIVPAKTSFYLQGTAKNMKMGKGMYCTVHRTPQAKISHFYFYQSQLPKSPPRDPHAWSFGESWTIQSTRHILDSPRVPSGWHSNAPSYPGSSSEDRIPTFDTVLGLAGPNLQRAIFFTFLSLCHPQFFEV
jgi:hypothetical protein